MDLTASSFRERLLNSTVRRISTAFCFWLLPVSVSALEHKVCLFCREYLLLAEQRCGELSCLGILCVVAKDVQVL